jgi:hypothetical protein
VRKLPLDLHIRLSDPWDNPRGRHGRVNEIKFVVSPSVSLDVNITRWEHPGSSQAFNRRGPAHGRRTCPTSYKRRSFTKCKYYINVTEAKQSPCERTGDVASEYEVTVFGTN